MKRILAMLLSVICALSFTCVSTYADEKSEDEEKAASIAESYLSAAAKNMWLYESNNLAEHTIQELVDPSGNSLLSDMSADVNTQKILSSMDNITYVIARFSALVISLSAIITFHLSLAAIMAVGSSMVKSTSSYTSSYYNSTISLFKEHFVSSSVSICWIIVNYLFGLLLIASIIWLIIVSTPRKFRVPLIVLLYFFIFFGVQRSSSWYHPALFIFNMIILSNALPYNLFPWSMLIFLLTTGLILFLLCKRWWTIYRW